MLTMAALTQAGVDLRFAQRIRVRRRLGWTAVREKPALVILVALFRMSRFDSRHEVLARLTHF